MKGQDHYATRCHRDKGRETDDKTGMRPYFDFVKAGNSNVRIISFDILEITGQLCPANCQLVRRERGGGVMDKNAQSDKKGSACRGREKDQKKYGKSLATSYALCSLCRCVG